MAYLAKIANPCPNCGKPATHRVYNRVNSVMGEYCHKCAIAAKKRQDEHEAREAQRERAPTP